MMEAAIDANAPLDYIEIHIFPLQNRYEACVTYLHKKEKVSSGLLEHLLLHSPKIKDLHCQGSNTKYGLNPPEYSHDIKWFTKSTLIRFLHIIGSANILEVTSTLKKEISQLEDARRFHLSLYTKGTQSNQTEEFDAGCTNSGGSATKAEDSDVSKNKLLHAIDSRLTALRGELTAAFDQAAGSRYSVAEMTDIEKFSRHCGSLELSDSLHKHIELIQGAQTAEKSGNHVTESLSSEVQFADVERQGYTESDGSSFSSEEEKQHERSRPRIRSASPRRSASPMRRVQIGRSGSRRSTAITIKSLNCIPAREKSYLPARGAASDSEGEGSQPEPKKSDNNVRISVQDAINLFERKQRDQKVDVRKSGTFSNGTICPNKAVLRRWSSGMGDNSVQHSQEIFHEAPVAKIQNDAENKEVKSDLQEHDIFSEDLSPEPFGLDVKMNSPVKEACSSVRTQEMLLTAPTDAGEKVISSAEWNRQKEVELNELFMKMMETKPVKTRASVPASNKRHSLPSEQRGCSYDHYKEKREEKLRGEAAGKRTEKDRHFKPIQQFSNVRKSQMALASGVDSERKPSVKKMQKPQKSSVEPANRKTESPKSGSVKKATPRSSSVPHIRKSSASLPSTRGPSPAKTPPIVDAMPARRRPRSTTPVSRSSPKVETSQIGTKPVKPNWDNSKKSSGNAVEKKQQSAKKPWQSVKGKVPAAANDHAPTAKPKPSLYIKVTKKSTIVPLESKPSLPKGSGTVSDANPSVNKEEALVSPQDVLQKSADMIEHEENLEVSNHSSPEILHEDDIAVTPEVIESVTTVRSPAIDDNNTENVTENQLNPDIEEESISPAAWVEIEENENQLATLEDCSWEMVDPSAANKAAPVVASSPPRVHHSLSQMLLEESSESDVPEWGNAANQPQVMDHKDSPKGFKRLLKFGRKSKTDTNAAAAAGGGLLISSVVFSEGEDEGECANKRNAEKLLRKSATLHSKNNVAGRPNLSNSSSSQDDHATTKGGGRSLFFSLSAFKGNK
ncbi:uncharacterized protein LOC127256468 isoform X2 [Andrographis paniculata]|uniref:uncharacterized protein LOC127256468 isoform X2 n=1 Tax=Andrographis paniculata TaxID=175694 RepID=UPI0021E8DE41|nr:uncharacterized protein LOC127256468 isoform X2 [Andrographis paniculata]